MPDFTARDLIIPRDRLNNRDWMRWVLEVVRVNEDGSINAFPKGGGFELRFSPQRIAHYDFIPVPPGMVEHPRWYKTVFRADWTEKDYEGWTTGDTWNGWATPNFEFEVARSLARDMRRANQPIRYNRRRDCFLVTREEYPEEPEEEYCAGFINVPGVGRIKTYAIGAYSWTWYEKEEEEPEEPYHSVKDWRPE